MTFRNSTTEPGQPWVSTNGKASACGERAWMKWMATGVVAIAAEVGAELRERVEPLLGGAEVVPVGPVGAELLGVRERQALRPVVDGLRFRPARAGETIAEVGDRVRTDLDPKLGDLAGHAPGRLVPVLAASLW